MDVCYYMTISIKKDVNLSDISAIDLKINFIAKYLEMLTALNNNGKLDGIIDNISNYKAELEEIKKRCCNDQETNNNYIKID